MLREPVKFFPEPPPFHMHSTFKDKEEEDQEDQEENGTENKILLCIIQIVANSLAEYYTISFSQNFFSNTFTVIQLRCLLETYLVRYLSRTREGRLIKYIFYALQCKVIFISSINLNILGI